MTKSPVSIREATVKDMSELMRLTFEVHKTSRRKKWALFEDSMTYWENWLLHCIDRNDMLCLVAEEGETIVGFTTGQIFPLFWNTSVLAAQETTSWVEPAYRKTGVGGALLDNMLQWAKHAGVSVFSIDVTANKEAKTTGRFLLDRGFSVQAKRYIKDL